LCRVGLASCNGTGVRQSRLNKWLLSYGHDSHDTKSSLHLRFQVIVKLSSNIDISLILPHPSHLLEPLATRSSARLIIVARSMDLLYSSHPLCDLRHEIRLLTILPKTARGDLSGVLSIASLKDNLNFVALSYCWNESAGHSPRDPTTNEILLNGYHLTIGKNLARFLREIRDGDFANRSFWIDAICINQTDLQERSAQVHRMRDIYGKANAVIIWLGSEAEHSHLAFEHIRFLANRCEANCPCLGTNKPQWTEVWSQKDSEWMNDAIVSGQHSKQWQALDHLFRRSWWRRTWTIQEMSIPQQPLVICGKEVLKWRQLTWFLGLCERHREPLELSLKAIEISVDFDLIVRAHRRGVLRDSQHWKDPHDLLNMLPRSGPLDLLQILYVTRLDGATDDHDKIYGVLALSSDAETVIPQPDYTLSAAMAYKSLVKSSICVRGNLDILSLVTAQGRLKLPTWCLDLTCNNALNSMNKAILMTADESVKFRASGSTKPVVSFSENLNTLKIQGIEFDAVDTYDLSIMSTTSHAPVQQCAYATDLSIFDAIWNTAIGGICWSYEANAFLAPPSILGGLFAILCCSTDNGPKAIPEASPDSSLTETENQSSTADNPIGPAEEAKKKDMNSFAFEWLKTNGDFVFANRTIREWCSAFTHLWTGEEDIGFPSHNYLQRRLEHAIRSASSSRKLVKTSRGYIGLAPLTTRPGDLVCILLGHRLPVILRAVDKYYLFIGECYVHGIMYGKPMELLESGTLQAKEFDIH
jgi:hypothetical protein